MKQRLTMIWLILSSFGIMFAILSWVQDSGIFTPILEGSRKGFMALITGFILYYLVASKT